MNNIAALGYMVIAAKELKIPVKKIEAITRMMYLAMDEWTDEEAEKVYKSF